jgi:hypothetical protein
MDTEEKETKANKYKEVHSHPTNIIRLQFPKATLTTHHPRPGYLGTCNGINRFQANLPDFITKPKWYSSAYIILRFLVRSPHSRDPRSRSPVYAGNKPELEFSTSHSHKEMPG